MYRSKIKTPLLKIEIHEPLKDEKIKLIQLLSSYIKGIEERDKIYTELEKLKKSIS